MPLFFCKLFVPPDKGRQFFCRGELLIGDSGKMFKKIHRDRTIHGNKLLLRLLSELCARSDGWMDDCPSGLMNSLFPVVWLKTKYSPGRATDKSRTRALASSRSAHTPSHLTQPSVSVLKRSKGAIIGRPYLKHACLVDYDVGTRR